MLPAVNLPLLSHPKHHCWLRHPSPMFLHTLWVNTSPQAQHMVVCSDVSTGQVPPAAHPLALTPLAEHSSLPSTGPAWSHPAPQPCPGNARRSRGCTYLESREAALLVGNDF